MWIRIKHGDRREVINSKAISKICIVDTSLYINYQNREYSKFVLDNPDEAQAWFDGITIALNGTDIILGEYSYIKPLLISKNKALHTHMMISEIISDNKEL